MTLYEHFRPEEKPFIDMVLEWKKLVTEKYVPKVTDFLDPRQQDILQSLFSQDEDIQIQSSGGYEGAERKRALIIPPYGEATPIGLSLFELNYPKKFATVEHRELLGSLLGLGLKRDKFGDLIFAGDRIQWICASEIADYVRLHLNQVGRVSVSCEEISFDQIIAPELHWAETSGSVASFRLDVILAEIYRLSRGRAAEFIKGGFVKVNWKRVDKPAFEVKEGDYLSLRGHGRSRLFEIGGETKRGNHWIQYGILK